MMSISNNFWLGKAGEATDLTGRTLAYKSKCLRKATMGEEYPATLWEGELTEPKRAP